MSAWLCEDDHLKFLAISLVRKTSRMDYSWLIARFNLKHSENPEEIASSIAQVLYDENIRSLNSRYRGEYDKYSDHKIKINLSEYEYWPHESNGVLAKSTGCYNYQACENDDYMESRARRVVNSLYEAIAQDQEGYEDAEWGYKPSHKIDRSRNIVRLIG